jgi:hypothetical protein
MVRKLLMQQQRRHASLLGGKAAFNLAAPPVAA